MAIIDMINFLNSDFISGISNAGQIYSVFANSAQLSNDEQLKKLMDELYSQDSNLDNLSKYSERLIFQLSKSLENDKIIIDQNEKLLKQNEEIIDMLSFLKEIKNDK